MRRSSIMAALGILILSACSGMGGNTVYQMIKVQVVMPKDMNVTHSSPVEDFEIYRFRFDGEDFLQAYVGNQPLFPSQKVDGAEEIDRIINGLKAHSISWRDSADLRSREVLIEINDGKWPRVVHFSYHRLLPRRAKTADRIIDSVRHTGAQN